MTAPTAIAPSSRRGAELVMTLLAIALAVVAYAAVGLGHNNKLPVGSLAYGAGLAALVIGAHLAVRRFAPYADPVFLPLAAALNGLGLVLIHRLDLAAADRAHQAGRHLPQADAPLQLVWTALGIAAFVAVLAVVRDHRQLQRYTYTAGLVGLVLLALPAILPAQYSTVHGARIWIRVSGFSLQPGELAKLALMVFFAGYLVAKRDVLALASRRFAGIDLPRGRDLGPVLAAWLASMAVLVLEKDLGTSLLFFGMFIAMLYVATERRSWLLIGVGLFALGSFAAYHAFGHVRDRVDIWLHPFRYASTTGYQLVQSMFGLAFGGILGTGLGQGRPDTVPFANSDFIISTVGEELGLAGLMAILVIYALLVMRGLRAALAVRDSFGKLLAAGLAFSLALQVFVVVGGVTRLIPLTGLTTPFLSYGGSSLLAEWALIALLVRISDAGRRPEDVPAAAGADDALTQVIRR
ncbi:MAG: FtsW/RodA/SpoVE family cell cycle protein [Actinomycetes bacterium]